MYERGEAIRPEDTYEVGPGLALGVLERFQDSEHTVYLRYTWGREQEPSITTREILEVKKIHTDLYPLSKGHLVTYREWSSDTSEIDPVTEIEAVTNYTAHKYGLYMDGFEGTSVSIANVLGPFFSSNRCKTEKNQHALIQALSATGQAGDPDLREHVIKYRNSLMKGYRTEDIQRYLRVTANVEVLPHILDRNMVAAEATRRIISELSSTKGLVAQGRKPRSAEELTADIFGLDEVDLLNGAHFTSQFAYRNLAFSQILHTRLHSDRRAETVQYLKDPLDFVRMYAGAILSQYAANPNDPGRHQPNAQKLLNWLRVGPHDIKLGLNRIITIANHVTVSLNAYEDKAKQLLPYSSVKDFRHVSGAFSRILEATRIEGGETPELAADRIHIGIIETLLKTATQRELGRQILS